MRKGWFAAVVVAGLIATGSLAIRARAAEGFLPVGSKAPEFSAISQEDKAVHLSDYKGKWVVLYFYPKDQTTGCTLEAHNFQRDMKKYEAAKAVVLGVSLDTVESHKTWCSKDTFSFKLLADPEHKVIDAYNVPIAERGTMKFAARTTYLIDPKGNVAKVWEVKDIPNHSDEILATIASHK
ncbi:peroxiredoxin [Terriglobus tenax]|uniref:peroxiredoxin n=1 Tax=Terriglobus tenax TaxID=1111115 RepID=UPI0021DFF37D|nr:peroxiredoxin [Terriglobus tenax]